MNHAFQRFGGVARVEETYLAFPPERVQQHWQANQRLPRLAPSPRIDPDTLACEIRLPPNGVRQSSLQFRPRGGGLPLPAEIGEKALRTGDKQGVNLGLGKAGEARLVVAQKAPAATRASFRHHRDARGAQRVHVAEDGALGNFQPGRQIPRGHAAVRLEEQQDGQKAPGPHRKSTLAAKYDTGCQESLLTLAA